MRDFLIPLPEIAAEMAEEPQMNAVVRHLGRVVAAGAVVGAAALGSGAVIASAAGATSSQITAYGAGAVQNDTLSIVRAGVSVAVKISFSTGTTYASGTNLQICASTAPFTSKVAGANCTKTSGNTLNSYTESGTSSSETITLPSAFTGKTAYLQVHADTLDWGVANTTMGCPVKGSIPLYGSCAVLASDDTELPSGGATGMVVIGGLAALGLGFMVLRSRRATASAA